MMLLSEALGRLVINAADARQVGTVARVVIDAHTAHITALCLQAMKDGGDVIAWQNVQAIGPDAVIVDAAQFMQLSPDEACVHRGLLNKRILTEEGEEIGTMTDLAFDPASGHIEELHTSKGQFPGQRILGLGTYALIVQADDPFRPT